MYSRLDSGLPQAELYLSLWLVQNSFLSLILYCLNWRQLALLLLLLSLSHCPTVSERIRKSLRITTWFLIPILNHPLRNSNKLPVSRLSTKPNMSNHLEYSGFILPPIELFVERLLERDWGVLSMDHSVLSIFVTHHKLTSQCIQGNGHKSSYQTKHVNPETQRKPGKSARANRSMSKFRYWPPRKTNRMSRKKR